ncbi:hypothetical protein DL98DRAFT_593943 [Cadophora sp. DSE1049]|nr:hypothetical protein DL98DRAFT_593943 [Cadophora sp. DSE1049]
MHFPTILKNLSSLLALAATVTGIGNCKCQDDNGQDNEATEWCCKEQDFPASYRGNEYHQCTSWSYNLNSDDFKFCCGYYWHVQDAYCWN